jgi:hypothetical protein
MRFVKVFSLASFLAITGLAANAQTMPPQIPNAPAHIPPGIGMPPQGAFNASDAIDRAYQLGLQTGQQVQAMMAQKQKEIDDLTAKCGDRCTPKPEAVPVSPKAPEKK